MGAVYLCDDLRLPGKKWALKEMILHDPGVAEQVRDSFTREARFLAGLRHRSLPAIGDVFASGDIQYIVMEYIEGETLAQRIESRGIPSDTTALSWALELTQVLDYLHRQERPIIFRDLKPENIIVSEEGHVKVIDFGLARHFEPGKHRDTQASGTVGYAPPEQWEDSGQSDPRSDIYSLAATLFFVLTGRPPSPIYGSHRIRPFRPEIDPAIEALVLKCLQPNPSQRYSTAVELMNDILILLSEEKHQGAMMKVDVNRESGTRPLTKSPQVSNKIASLKRPMSFPQSLPIFLGVGVVLFLFGLILPFVDLRAGAQRDSFHADDGYSEMLSETDPLKAEARSLIGEGHYEEAIALLDSLCTRYPQDPEALIMKSNAYAALSGLEVYKIPVISSWHGSQREGLQLLFGYGLAQIQANQARTGKKPLVMLELYDDRSSNEELLSTAKTLAESAETPLILGPFTSQQTRLIAPIANSKGLPVLAPVASDPQVLSTGRYIFSAADTDRKKVEALAHYIYDSGKRKVAIFNDESSIISRSLGDAFLDAFQEKGGLIALSEDYPSNQVDFSSQVQQAHKQEADCIFLSEYRAPPVINFCESLRAANWQPLVSTQTAVFSESIFRHGEKLVEGLLMSTYYVPDRNGKRGNDFNRVFHQTFAGKRPTHREVNSYDSLNLVIEAMDKVGQKRESLQEYFASLGNENPAYTGVSGTFALARTLGERPSYVLRVHNGGYEMVKSEE